MLTCFTNRDFAFRYYFFVDIARVTNSYSAMIYVFWEGWEQSLGLIFRSLSLHLSRSICVAFFVESHFLDYHRIKFSQNNKEQINFVITKEQFILWCENKLIRCKSKKPSTYIIFKKYLIALLANPPSKVKKKSNDVFLTFFYDSLL